MSEITLEKLDQLHPRLRNWPSQDYLPTIYVSKFQKSYLHMLSRCLYPAVTIDKRKLRMRQRKKIWKRIRHTLQDTVVLLYYTKNKLPMFRSLITVPEETLEKVNVNKSDKGGIIEVIRRYQQ